MISLRSLSVRSALLVRNLALKSRSSNVSWRVAPVRSQLRYFSNEDLKKICNDVGKDNADPNSEKVSSSSADSATDASSTAEGAKTETTEPLFEGPQQSAGSKALEFVRNSYSFVVDNVRLAYSEMIGEDKESTLSRNVQQAATFRPAKKAVDSDDEDAEKDEEATPTGPNAIVVVKEAKSAWESMRDRLQDSPLIREMLKSGKNFRKAAVQTDIGKQAENLGRSVQDKISDAREFWETSQNPIVYTLSGAWDNIAGETAEGIAVKEILKLDPKFNKVLSR